MDRGKIGSYIYMAVALGFFLAVFGYGFYKAIQPERVSYTVRVFDLAKGHFDNEYHTNVYTHGQGKIKLVGPSYYSFEIGKWYQINGTKIGRDVLPTSIKEVEKPK